MIFMKLMRSKQVKFILSFLRTYSAYLHGYDIEDRTLRCLYYLINKLDHNSKFILINCCECSIYKHIFLPMSLPKHFVSITLILINISTSFITLLENHFAVLINIHYKIKCYLFIINKQK